MSCRLSFRYFAARCLISYMEGKVSLSRGSPGWLEFYLSMSLSIQSTSLSSNLSAKCSSTMSGVVEQSEGVPLVPSELCGKFLTATRLGERHDSLVQHHVEMYSTSLPGLRTPESPRIRCDGLLSVTERRSRAQLFLATSRWLMGDTWSNALGPQVAHTYPHLPLPKTNICDVSGGAGVAFLQGQSGSP